jgi:hypothetical protein
MSKLVMLRNRSCSVWFDLCEAELPGPFTDASIQIAGILFLGGSPGETASCERLA